MSSGATYSLTAEGAESQDTLQSISSKQWLDRQLTWQLHKQAESFSLRKLKMPVLSEETLRRRIGASSHDSCQYRTYAFATLMVTSARFDLLMGMLVAANAVAMCLESEMQATEEGSSPAQIFRTLDLCFLCAFTLELFLRIFDSSYNERMNE